MRFLILLSLITLTSCSWMWPFGKNEAAHCMDDNSCDEARPIDEALTKGDWYCYGVSRDEPWDCRKSPDAARIASIPETEETVPLENGNDDQPVMSDSTRAEMAIRDYISTRPEAAPESAPAIEEEADGTIFQYPDDFFAVQLIAMQSFDEIGRFAREHKLAEPQWVRIESQGSDWYVLLLGFYPTQTEAEAAANRFTEEQRPGTKPWVRPLGPLKRAVLRAQPADS